MIVDAFVMLLGGLLNGVLSVLPAGHLGLPDPAGLASSLVGLDSLVPVLGVLRLGAVMLLALVGFVIVRVLVFLRYLLLP